MLLLIADDAKKEITPPNINIIINNINWALAKFLILGFSVLLLKAFLKRTTSPTIGIENITIYFKYIWVLIL